MSDAGISTSIRAVIRVHITLTTLSLRLYTDDRYDWVRIV